MKFTIAIPTHNNEDTIEDALKSALNVDFDDFEVYKYYYRHDHRSDRS